MKLVGERRAVAAFVFAFYFLMYGVMALSGAIPEELVKAFVAIAGVYGLAFFSLVAGYFWARWYSVGVGLYGVITSAVGIWQIGAEPVLLFLGITHAVAALALWGTAMSEPYDGQTAWRERYHMDDNAVQRLGRSVIRAGVSLPFVLLYALVPKPDSALAFGAFAALALTGLGLRALVRMKTWGILALGAAGSLLVGMAGASAAGIAFAPLATGSLALTLAPAIAGLLLLAAAAPFAAPIVRALAGRR